MKGRIWFFCLSVILLAVSNANLAAQSSCFTYSSNYADYESTSGSSDGTTIYSSVTVDGSGTMTFIGGNGCSQINYNQIVHIPIAVNVIVSPSGNHVGGQLNGTSGCPSCYISEVNNQSVANVNPGDQYTFNYATVVACSLGATVYSTSGNWGFGIATTYGQWVTGAPPGACNYNAACTNTSTPKCGSNGWTSGTNQNNGCSYYVWAAWVWEPPGHSGTKWGCYGINSNGLPVSAPGPCTPQ